MSARVELLVPTVFWDDHITRDCEIGAGIAEVDRSIELKATGRGTTVSMTHTAIAELWSDADYYASEMGRNYPGLASSARATLRAIRRQYEPATDWSLDPRIRL
jgi:hypothetical protein